MEFEKKGKTLAKLPGQFVDTGMGLERISAVLTNKTIIMILIYLSTYLKRQVWKLKVT